MNTMYVVNLFNGAVTTYTGIPTRGLTNNYVGGASGVYAFDGDSPVDGSFTISTAELTNEGRKTYLPGLIVGMQNGQGTTCRVVSEVGTYSYSVNPGRDGVGKCLFGRGTRTNYAEIELKNSTSNGWVVYWADVEHSFSDHRRSS